MKLAAITTQYVRMLTNGLATGELAQWLTARRSA